nr:MAG TPA: hypothetical protein [Caudoviricetes sp.]
MKRQSCDSFRQNMPPRIHRRHLHGRSFVYLFAGAAAAHEKSVGTARCTVLGSISAPK